MITTNRLLIKLWTKDMASDFYELSKDPGFTLFPITDYRQASIESARQWIQKNTCKYAVIEKETHHLLGMGGLTPWKWKDENLTDITYRLRSAAQGKGFGIELAKALVSHAFDVLQLQQVTATITPDNIPSKKIADKLGMKLDQRIELMGIPTDLYRLYK